MSNIEKTDMILNLLAKFHNANNSSGAIYNVEVAHLISETASALGEDFTIVSARAKQMKLKAEKEYWNNQKQA